MSMTPEERRARVAEQSRQYREANKEKEAERKRKHYKANKEKAAEKQRKHYKANKEEMAERNRRYSEANKEKLAEGKRRYHRRKVFAKEDGSSFEAWLASLNKPASIFIAIANLQPDPGQTLTQLIHELSGYAMEVCEQIANPPVIEEPQPTQPEPQPDLF